jgi:uncharacterized protein YegP (UPF0339 family)
MRLLPIAKNLFKKGLIVSVLLAAFVLVNAQTNNVNTVEVKGKVTDAASHQPLRAIRVTYQNLSAAITDSAGNFALKVPNYNVTVMFQGEGFQTKEVALKGRRTISTSLYEDTYVSFYDGANLPFRTQSINRIPFAVTSVQATRNWAHTAETPDALLQGKVAGLNTIRRSGTPNIGANFFLRGISSLYTSNQPLIIVDGVIYDNND